MGLIDLDLIKRAIIARQPVWANLAWVCAGLLLAATVRYAVDAGQNGVPFVTFYPVVLLAAVFLGGRYAAFAAVVSGIFVRFLFAPGPWLDFEHPARLAIILLYGLTILIIIATGDTVRRLVLENDTHIRQQDTFNAELQHRTKNALQIMRALISRGPRGEDPQAYFKALAGRLDALAKSNELLRFGMLESADTENLVHAAIAPFDESRFTLSGPACPVARDAVTPLMMALHELCTNATKYGSLSGGQGTVSVKWDAEGTAGIAIHWREIGGPPVSPPAHRGLGTRLLAAHGGLTRVDLTWDPAGLECEMVARMAKTPR